MSMANAGMPFNTSVEYNDVKYHIDQCHSSGGEFYVTGWYLSGKDYSPGDIKLFVNDNGTTKEVPVVRRDRQDVSEEFSLKGSSKPGFSGSIEISNSFNSFSHDVEIIEKSDSGDKKINYTCNSTKDNVF